jgi:hypothetical protein
LRRKRIKSKDISRGLKNEILPGGRIDYLEQL